MAGMRSQPQAGQRLNQAHPLARGLVGFWFPSTGAFVSAFPGVQPATLGAAALFSGDEKGRRLGSNGAGLAATIPHNARVKPSTAITVLIAGVMPVGSAGGYPYAFGCESSNDGWGVYHYGGAGGQLHPYLRVGSAWADQPANIGGGDAGQVGFTFDGATFWSVTNGQRSSSQAISGSVTNSSIGISLNAVRPNGENPGDGKYHYFAIWSRALSPGELASFHANPWQIFDDGEDGAEVLSTPAGYRLTAAVAAFSLGGVASGLRTSRRLQATRAQYSLGGVVAGLRSQRRLLAARGDYGFVSSSAVLAALRRMVGSSSIFALAGVAAQLRADRRLTASSMPLELGSPVADLRATRRLLASAGSMSTAGMSVGLRANRRISAVSASFALAGSGINMMYAPAPGAGGPTYTLTAASGAFDVAGVAATLRADRRLPAAFGGFLLTGAGAAVMVGRRLSAGTGGFTLQEQAARLCAARLLPAEPGAFDLVGAAAQLRYSAQIDYARAPAGPGYAPQRHYNESRPVAISSPRPAATQRNFR